MLTQLTNNKKVQRKELLAKRRALTLIQKNEYSAVITKQIVELEEYKNSQICFLYASMPDEFQTKELIVNALKAGKQICLPYITDKNMKIMQATLIKSLDELVVGAYNILTVKEKNLRIVKPQDIDFILVPAVGLDKKGYRLGMGGGYYDRYLVKAINAKKIAAVYDCQLVDEVIKDDYDFKVDMILTENTTIKYR